MVSEGEEEPTKKKIPCGFWVLAELQSPTVFRFWPYFNLLCFLGSGRSSISCGFLVLADFQSPTFFGFWPIFNELWFFGFWPNFNSLWFLGSGRSSISCGFGVLADLQFPMFIGFWPNFNHLWFLSSGRLSISCGFGVIGVYAVKLGLKFLKRKLWIHSLHMRYKMFFFFFFFFFLGRGGFWPNFNPLWFGVVAELQSLTVFGFWPIINPLRFWGSGRTSVPYGFEVLAEL